MKRYGGFSQIPVSFEQDTGLRKKIIERFFNLFVFNIRASS
jgi:hypothetical protein